MQLGAPGLRQRAVRGVAQQLMTELEPRRRRGVARRGRDEIALDESVHHVGQLALLQAGHERGELRHREDLADHRRVGECLTFVVGKPVQTRRQQAGQRRRGHACGAAARVVGCPPAFPVAHETPDLEQHRHVLVQEERVASACGDEARREIVFHRPVGHDVAHEVGSLTPGERLERDRDRVRGAAAPAGALLEQLRTRDRDHQLGHPAAAFGELHHQVEEGRFRPLQVVEHEHERPFGGEQLEVAPDRPQRLLGRPARAAESDRLAHHRRHAGRLGRHQRRDLRLGDLRLVVAADRGGGRHRLAHREERDAVAVGQAAPAQHQRVALEARDGLLDEPGLADAGLAEHGRELRAPVAQRPAVGELQQRELVLATDVRRARRPAGAAVEAEQPEALDRLVEPLEGQGARGLDAHLVAHEPLGRGRQQDLAVGGCGLQPGGEVRRAAEHGRPAAGQHLPGRDAGAHLEPDRPPAFELVVQARERGVHLVGGPHRAQRVVLVHRGRAEGGQHGITDELPDGAAVLLDGVAHRLVVAGHDPAEALGVEPFRQRGRADDVGEHDRDRPPRAALVRRRRGRAARRAEARVGRQRRSARLAARHRSARPPGSRCDPEHRTKQVTGIRAGAERRAPSEQPAAQTCVGLR